MAGGLYFLGGNCLSPPGPTCIGRQVPKAALHGNLHLCSPALREIVSAYLKNLREQRLTTSCRRGSPGRGLWGLPGRGIKNYEDIFSTSLSFQFPFTHSRFIFMNARDKVPGDTDAFSHITKPSRKYFSSQFIVFLDHHYPPSVATLRVIAGITVIIIITIGGNNHFLTPNTFPGLPYLRFHLIMVISKNEGWYCGWNFILLDFHSTEPVSPWISVLRLVLCPLEFSSPWYCPCEAAFPRSLTARLCFHLLCMRCLFIFSYHRRQHKGKTTVQRKIP